MRTFLGFSGQGSQYYNMGRELFHEHPTFQSCLLHADQLVKERWNFSLISKLYDPSKRVQDPMEEIRLSHPALFAVQYAMAMSILENHPIDVVFGFSLGEIVAMTVAGICSFELAFSHILDQVDILESSCQKGRLIVVFESSVVIDTALEAYSKNYSYAIISGIKNNTLSLRECDRASIEASLKKQGIPYQFIPVNYPFHSPWIEIIKEQILSKTRALTFQRSRLSFASCTMMQFVGKPDSNTFWDIIRHPLQLEQFLRDFIEQPDIVIDCSPTSVIKALMRSIYGFDSMRFKNTHIIMSKFNQNSLNHLQQLSWNL